MAHALAELPECSQYFVALVEDGRSYSSSRRVKCGLRYTQHTIPDESLGRRCPSIYDETIQKIRDEIKDIQFGFPYDTPDKEEKYKTIVKLFNEYGYPVAKGYYVR
ncbi:hypothetical protein ANN_26442 [Periplaneta americana]|uniref:Uncharacterized protein n=1 Tax=Periplaneta americana TaxID=6978 RepID=A0ABQ8RY66_PERAM|nr:hypothetical protein ANN_26442 [Periplaneta americana]